MQWDTVQRPEFREMSREARIRPCGLGHKAGSYWILEWTSREDSLLTYTPEPCEKMEIDGDYQPYSSAPEFKPEIARFPTAMRRTNEGQISDSHGEQRRSWRKKMCKSPYMCSIGGPER